MTEQIVIAPFLVAFVTAIATLATRKFSKLQIGLSLTGGILYAFIALILVARVQNTVLTYQLSSWPAPYGITFVADALSGFMLAITALVMIPTMFYSLKYMDRFSHSVSYQPLFHFMTAGVTGAFLTGDLFNLFVWFEVILMSSYILVAFYGKKEHTLSAFKYVVINLIGSAMMLLAIGGLYATTGTLNIADLAVRLGNPAQYGITIEPVIGFTALLFCIFSLKAGIAPFQFWAPEAYQAAPAPVSAMLAGAAKKVGTYAMIRIYVGILSGIPFSGAFGISRFGEFFGPLMLLMATLSIFIGGFGATSRNRLDAMLSYSSIGQVGFTLLPIGLAALKPELAVIGITGSLLYCLHHAGAKSMLFMIAGNIRRATGTNDYSKLGGLSSSMRLNSAAFMIGGLSLIGVPPVIGFFGKFSILKAFSTTLPLLIVLIMGSMLTIYYISKAWNQVFWGDKKQIKNVDNSLLTPVAFSALMIILLGLGIDTIYPMAENAAEAAMATENYVEAVMEVKAE